ncbi:hypothetical protein CYMTET_21482 [Cymbomonas tetramitiformis]|uniref:Cyclic nucleotide-binding domain-containing protein n=1 Tax=Cymbomonas tetramitiformis TaxID=36881 RepID=A0AAE0L2U6_9CHLO|nr:hypothetical protein CYMTET_21482 [Cymbomonas tetramitiformis]
MALFWQAINRAKEREDVDAEVLGKLEPVVNLVRPLDPSGAPSGGFAQAVKAIRDKDKEYKRKVEACLHNTSFTLLNKLRAGCAKDPKNRSEADVLELCAVCSVMLKYFADKPFRALLQICPHLKLESYQSNSYICRQGEIGDRFFVIASGTVSFVTSSNGNNENVATLARGQGFGDTALLTGAPRGANAIAAGAVDLVTLEKAVFKKVLQRECEVMLGRSVQFLKTHVRIFASIPHSTCMRFAHQLSVVFFPKGYEFMVDKNNKIYFIKLGSVRLVMPFKRNIMDDQNALNVAKRPDGTMLRGPHPITFKGKMQQLGGGVVSDMLEVCTLGAGNFFGESAYFDDVKQGWMAKANTNLELLQITKSNFAYTATEEVKQAMHDEAIFRLKYYAGRRGIAINSSTANQPRLVQWNNLIEAGLEKKAKEKSASATNAGPKVQTVNHQYSPDMDLNGQKCSGLTFISNVVLEDCPPGQVPPLLNLQSLPPHSKTLKPILTEIPSGSLELPTPPPASTKSKINLISHAKSMELHNTTSSDTVLHMQTSNIGAHFSSCVSSPAGKWPSKHPDSLLMDRAGHNISRTPGLPYDFRSLQPCVQRRNPLLEAPLRVQNMIKIKPRYKVKRVQSSSSRRDKINPGHTSEGRDPGPMGLHGVHSLPYLSQDDPLIQSVQAHIHKDSIVDAVSS